MGFFIFEFFYNGHKDKRHLIDNTATSAIFFTLFKCV